MPRSVEGATVLGPFGDFLADYKKLIAAMLGIGALPAVLDLVMYIGPPWPHRRAIATFTCLMVWVILPWTFASWREIAEGRLRRRLSLFAVLTLALLLLYIILKAYFVYDAPTAKDQEADGFILRSSIRRLLTEDPKMTIEDVRIGSEYNPMQIWVPWTVATVRVALLMAWLGLFNFLSMASSAFLLVQERTARRRGGGAWGTGGVRRRLPPAAAMSGAEESEAKGRKGRIGVPDRLALVRDLSGLAPTDWASLVTSIEGAAAHVSHNLPIPEQVAQLVRWAESPNGPKLATVEEAFKELRNP